MRRFPFLLAGLLPLALAAGTDAAPSSSPFPPIALSATDRVLVLAPHPDDDILCCGGLIQEAVARHLPVRVVYLTYGDNYEWAFLLYKKHPVVEPKALRDMGLLRRKEALAGEGILGVPPENLVFLGYPDFGTLKIWTNHWGALPPYKSMLTRVTGVPYPNARRPGAGYRGEEILRDLKEILAEFRPTVIFVSHPGDQHPDHRALPLYLNVALWELGKDFHPRLYPYLVHLRHWPEPQGLRPELTLTPPPFFQAMNTWWTSPLDTTALEKKRRALEAHRTQMGKDRRYLDSFLRANELFGSFPVVHADPRSSRPGIGLDRPPDSEPEPAAWAGVEHKSIGVEAGCLVVTARARLPLKRRLNLAIYAFGFRPDQPFAKMPKLRLLVDGTLPHAFDQNRELPAGGVKVNRLADRVTVRIPFALMGNPTKVMVSVRSRYVVFPLDWATWHVVELGPTP